MTINYDKVAAQIEQAILLKEVDITDEDWGVSAQSHQYCLNISIKDKPCVCPMGAVLLGTPSKSFLSQDAATILNVPEDFVVGFIHGFDGRELGYNLLFNPQKVLEDSYIIGHELGQDFRAKYI